MRKILAADLFCGMGGTSEGLFRAARALGVEVDLVAVNHWPRAVETHSLNHPEARHLCTGVDLVDPRDLVPGGHLDLLVASPECFPAGTLVLTSKGQKPIESIRYGDLVLTHGEGWRMVTRTMKKIADTCIVKGHGHPGLETTLNHTFLSRGRGRRWNQASRRYDHDWSEPDWTEAASLKGRYWATPNVFNARVHSPVPDELQKRLGYSETIPDAFFWMLGRWLGDGSNDVRPGRGGGVTICCGKHEADDLEPLLAQSGVGVWRRREVRTATLFDLRSRWLSDLLFDEFGHGALGKNLPTWALASLLKNQRRALLDGYLAADGHFDGRKQEVATISKSLAIGVRLLAESLGNRTSLHRAPQHASVIEGRRVDVHDVYRVMWVADPKRDYAHEIERKTWGLVKSVEPCRKNVEVYNLSVEDDESYIVEGIVVHNCTHHSIARGGRPMSDQSRASAWCVAHWASRIQVDRIIVENVPEFLAWGPLDPSGKPIKAKRGAMFRSWVRTLEDLGYEVQHRVLNCADFGDPTTRKRLFVVASLGGAVEWPEASHCDPRLLAECLVPETRAPWRTAREIIDWSLEGRSIFGRKKPLAEKTLRRTFAGLARFSGVAAYPHLVALRSYMAGLGMEPPELPAHFDGSAVGSPSACLLPHLGVTGNNQPRPLDAPLHTVTASHGAGKIIEPCILPHQRGWEGDSTDSTDRPMRTVTGHTKAMLAEPILSAYHSGAGGENRNQALTDPIGTLDCSNRYALTEPVIVTVNHGNTPGEDGDTRRSQSVDAPLGTVTTSRGKAVAQPFVLPHRQHDRMDVDPVDAPMRTITAQNGRQNHLAEPVIIPNFGERDGQEPRAHAVGAPLPAVTSHGAGMLVTLHTGEEFLVDVRLRMLRPHELAAAMGMEGYRVTGTLEEQVRQIGNAVPANTAAALCRAQINSLIGGGV